jgi:parallel beta-helix repeat protein
VISGNTNSGVIIRNPGSDNNVIEGNLIGVGPDGVTPVANGVHGIEIIDAAAWNRIGDAIAGAGNTISGNAVNGILMQAASSNIVTGNNISGNQGSGVVVLDP